MKKTRASEILSSLYSIAGSWGSQECVATLAIRDQSNANCTSTGPFKKTPNLNTSLSWSRINDQGIFWHLALMTIHWEMLSSQKKAHGPVTWPCPSFQLLVPTSYFLCETLTRYCGSNYGGVAKAFPPTLHPFIVSLVKVSVVLSRVLRESSRRDGWNPNRHVHRLCSWHQSTDTSCAVLIPGTTFFWRRGCVPGLSIRLMAPFSALCSA